MSEDLAVLGRVALAMLFGAMLGLDRELAKKPAGLRTHMLVSGAACLFVSIGLWVQIFYAGAEQSGEINIQSDPMRIIEAVITGISFLGAGTILRSGDANKVEGLTTAATVLLASALGLLVGVGHWMLAGGITLMTLIALHGMHLINKRIERRSGDH